MKENLHKVYTTDQGTYTWPDGEQYVGEWKDNVRHGQGIFTNKVGEKYEGEFAQGLYNGSRHLHIY